MPRARWSCFDIEVLPGNGKTGPADCASACAARYKKTNNCTCFVSARFIWNLLARATGFFESAASRRIFGLERCCLRSSAGPTNSNGEAQVLVRQPKSTLRRAIHRLPADSRQIDKLLVNNAVPLGQKLVHAVAESYNNPRPTPHSNFLQ